MKMEIIVHAKEFAVEREYIDSVVAKNLNERLDSYLKKYEKDGGEGRVELTLTRAKHEKFNGKLSLWLDGKTFRSDREDFQKFDDLIDHLFIHIKDQMDK
jgi:uncharacterized membrane protein